MTEDEARTKWCPHVRHMRWPSSDPSGGNQPKEASLCIASDCMMWVQDSSYWAKEGVRVKLEDTHDYVTPEDGGLETTTEGHCGLIHK